MVNRGKSGVRVSVACVSGRPVLRASLPWGFGVERCDRASQADGDVCCCSGGCGESPVQAALSSAGWEKSRGSSPGIKQRGEREKSKKNTHPFCFRVVVFPLLWVWESASVCPPGDARWHLVLLWDMRRGGTSPLTYSQSPRPRKCGH